MSDEDLHISYSVIDYVPAIGGVIHHVRNRNIFNKLKKSVESDLPPGTPLGDLGEMYTSLRIYRGVSDQRTRAIDRELNYHRYQDFAASAVMSASILALGAYIILYSFR